MCHMLAHMPKEVPKLPSQVWHQSTSTFPYFKGVTNIVAWWVISPILAGAVGAAVFWLARTFVLR